MSYESPIKLIQSEIEDGIYNKIRIVVDVDKEELIKALRYDRNQYEKGYSDAKKEQIHCKECKHWRYNACFVDSKTSEDAESIILDRFADDYCSRAERKDNE